MYFPLLCTMIVTRRCDVSLVLMIVAALAVVYGALAVYFYYGFKRKMTL